MKSAWLQNRDQRDILIAMTPNRSCNAPNSRSDLHNSENSRVSCPTESGAATMLRQSEKVLHIANATCRRSNRVLGFVKKYRVHLLMKELYPSANSCKFGRTANLCKPGLIVGALRVACDGLCTVARFHNADEHPGCILGALKDLIDCGIFNCCPTLFDHLNSLLPCTSECISPTAIINDLLFKIAVRSDRLCILVSGLLEAFVAVAFNWRRSNRGLGINIRELSYGRVKMMAVLCLAWAL